MSGVATLSADQPFLPALVEGLIDRLGVELADALILLPSRRACLAMRDAFLEHCGPDDAMLLPRLQPIADAGSDELPLGVDDGDIPPAIDPLRRQLLLAQLVQVQRKQTDKPITDEHAVRLASDLAAFLDEMQTEEIELSALDALVPDELADHWQEVLLFLQVMSNAWPSVLKAEGGVDPALRRRLTLNATCRRWRERPPSHPVIAAGVTGTIPAVARLLNVVRGLQKGQIVLPGLDMHLDGASWQALQDAPTHPQFGLAKLLRYFDVERSAVVDWQDLQSGARPRFWSEILRPALTSDRWRQIEAPGPDALDGLKRCECPDFASEAELLALKMREALEMPGKRVALVTSDRTLGRRVAAELKRFGVDVDDSAGTPLDQTPPGSFLILSARAIIDNLPPVPLLALLKHPLSQGGMTPGEFRSRARSLERVALRGVRRSGGFAELRSVISDQAESEYWPGPIDADGLADWLDRIERSSAELRRLAERGKATFAELIAAHLRFAEWLAADDTGDPRELWLKEAGQAASQFISRLLDAAEGLEPISVQAYPALLAVLMGGAAVHPQHQRHPRAQILGQLESRLASADMILIGGLNENVWPRPPEASPWLNRAMRHGLGLPPAEQQIGIAAHDFSQAASAPEVLLSRSRKDAAGAPTTPSRWLARLDAVLLAKAMDDCIDLEPHWRQWAMLKVSPAIVEPGPRPEPRPPLDARPRQFWVTDIEMLMRNPYQFYARRILDLRELDPLDAEPGAAERGQIVHAALEEFVRRFPIDLPKNPLAELDAIGERFFDAFDSSPQVRAIWLPRFRQIGVWFIDQETKRRERMQRVLAERTGKAEFESRSGRFTLMARADRLELAEREMAIIDYKTGQIPSGRDVASGLKPQLPLTALIAEAGGFDGIEGLSATELLYWGLKGGAEPAIDKNPLERFDPVKVIEDAKAGIARLIDYFQEAKTPYPAVPRPEIAGLDTAFDHLARHKEWQVSLAVRGDRE